MDNRNAPIPPHFGQAKSDGSDGFRPSPALLAGLDAIIELPPLPGAFAYRAGGNAKSLCCGFDLGDKGSDFGLHGLQTSVIFHTSQRETSHSHSRDAAGKFLTMDESETFRTNLLAAMDRLNLTEAELSVKAGLNRRAVTDIRERRVQSPKLSTVFKLANALDEDPAVMLGLGRRYDLHPELADFLSQYDELDQARFLAALSALPRTPA